MSALFHCRWLFHRFSFVGAEVNIRDTNSLPLASANGIEILFAIYISVNQFVNFILSFFISSVGVE